MRTHRDGDENAKWKRGRNWQECKERKRKRDGNKNTKEERQLVMKTQGDRIMIRRGILIEKHRWWWGDRLKGIHFNEDILRRTAGNYETDWEGQLAIRTDDGETLYWER